MQKQKLWGLFTLIIVCLVSLLYWLKPMSTQANNLQSTQQMNTQMQMMPSTQAIQVNQNTSFASSSQKDTQINCQLSFDANNHLIVNEQTRDCFEYFITQYGEKNLDQIRQDFKAYVQANYKNPAQAQILDLWDRYMKYRTALGNIKAPSIDPNNPQYYRMIYNETQDLRKQFFSSYEIEGLFGIEDTYHEYTLKRLDVLADKSLTEIQKAKKLKDLFNELPESWKENLEQINKLDDLRKLTADIQARGGSVSELREMRLNLVGSAATQRLETLDAQRSEWKTKVNQYLDQRDSILNSGLSDEAKQKAIQQLKTQSFSQSTDQLRVGTFETVHDSGGKLPFSN